MNCIRNSRPSGHSRILSVRLAVTSFVLLFVISPNLTGWSASREPTAPSASQEGLASVLQADGSLRAGVAGSFDASGYRMELTATGAPRFVPAQAACGTADWDAQFGPPNGTNGEVDALAVMGNAIYVGGNFTFAGNVAANRVAKFDTTTNTWSALSEGGGNGVNNGSVKALAVSGNSLFVGGDFTLAGAVGANQVAKFDTTTNTWSALTQGDGNGVSGTVNALAVIGNSVFVGGQIRVANLGGTGATPEISVNAVAKFDTTSQHLERALARQRQWRGQPGLGAGGEWQQPLRRRLLLYGECGRHGRHACDPRQQCGEVRHDDQHLERALARQRQWHERRGLCAGGEWQQPLRRRLLRDGESGRHGRHACHPRQQCGEVRHHDQHLERAHARQRQWREQRRRGAGGEWQQPLRRRGLHDGESGRHGRHACDPRQPGGEVRHRRPTPGARSRKATAMA